MDAGNNSTPLLLSACNLFPEQVHCCYGPGGARRFRLVDWFVSQDGQTAGLFSSKGSQDSPAVHFGVPILGLVIVLVVVVILLTTIVYTTSRCCVPRCLVDHSLPPTTSYPHRSPAPVSQSPSTDCRVPSPQTQPPHFVLHPRGPRHLQHISSPVFILLSIWPLSDSSIVGYSLQFVATTAQPHVNRCQLLPNPVRSGASTDLASSAPINNRDPDNNNFSLLHPTTRSPCPSNSRRRRSAPDRWLRSLRISPTRSARS